MKFDLQNKKVLIEAFNYFYKEKQIPITYYSNINVLF